MLSRMEQLLMRRTLQSAIPTVRRQTSLRMVVTGIGIREYAPRRKPLQPVTELPEAQMKKNEGHMSSFRKRFVLAVAGFFRMSSVGPVSAKVSEGMYFACTKPALKDDSPISQFWYNECALPPSFQTWFQITSLHVWMLMVRFRALPKHMVKHYQQHTIDFFFYNCEDRLRHDYKIRNPGIVNTTMKDLYMQFRGLTAAYDEGMCKTDPVLATAIWRNVFAGKTDVDLTTLMKVTSFVRRNVYELEHVQDHDVAMGKIQFSEPI